MPPHVFITGASKGIGASIARLAAQRGYAVAIGYHHDHAGSLEVLRSIEAEGGTACVVQGDVGDMAQAERMLAEAQAALGPLQVLVNNAAITGPIGKFVQADPNVIEQVFRTNVLGTMHCCRAAVRAFQSAGRGGVIVNVSSTAATTGSPGEYVHYAASKAAVDSFTLGLARELAAEGIRVCAVAPGSTLTGIHARAGEPDRPLRIAPLVPMKRLAEPDEIAEAVLWMMSDAASYVTGAVLRCSGGL
ncbi:SDR family oxidoreductase [Massilia sp. TS11]|uniref:SDR family oxidoreductase n=1 Tax=Massilia sp. TS11 TaxID=2908003 RepID=UPI001EDBFEA1|nr:SDR family oxidoreductase [Massilia sp. TS11]MCG2584346.1 SDR family oxidoreductase [Massilia sp. TS11]